MANYTVQEFALQYAQTLVRFHEVSYHCEGSILAEDRQLLDQARNELFSAQERLNSAARRNAELNYTA